jgi:hypothetical protein
MLYMDAPDHTRLRGLAAAAFTPRRVEVLRDFIQKIVDDLLDRVQARGQMDIMADFADPMPAMVTAEMIGVPVEDSLRLKKLSADFAEILGNFHHDPDRIPEILDSTSKLTEYFQAAIAEARQRPREGLINSFLTAGDGGDRLSDEDIVANCILTMIGGLETTTNLIGIGLLTLTRNPGKLARLRDDPSLIPTAVEELLRFESPVQHTGRIAPEDVEMGGKQIRKGQSVMAVIAAANRDPERFPDPDELILDRQDNKHLAFGWASHFCFGAPLARMKVQIAFKTLLRRLPNLKVTPGPLTWRSNHGLRGLDALPVTFDAPGME